MTTKIEWTRSDDGSAGETWNPTSGCDRVSEGCDRCYALDMAKRLKAMGSAKYQRDGDPRTSGPGFGITEHPDTLDLPFTWKKPRRVFVNSMSDLFHDGVSDRFIARVFAVMALTPQHTYQLLTKRHGRMRSLLSSGLFVAQVWGEADKLAPGVGAQRVSSWPSMPLPNVWIGVSAEDQAHAALRVPALLETPAAVRWVSAEPLIGPIDFRNLAVRNVLIDALGGDVKAHDGAVLTGTPSVLDWIVLGGESGSGARPMEHAWISDVLRQASDRTPVFVKQMGSVLASDLFWGGKSAAASGDRKGGDPKFWPRGLDVREYPRAATA